MRYWFWVLVFLSSIVWADVDTKDGTAITTTSNIDGFSSNIDDYDGQVVASGVSDCPGGTYLSYWDGEHSSGEQYLCYNSGSNSADHTADDGTDRIDTTAGSSGKAFNKTGTNQYTEWANSGTDRFDRSTGTIWLRIRCQTTLADHCIWGLVIDGNNYITIDIRDDNRLRGQYYGTADNENHSSAAGDTISDNTWTWVGYTWNTSTGIHCATVDDGSWSWSCSGNEITTLASDPTDFGMGENDWGDEPDTDNVDIDKFYIYGTYQANHP